MTENTTPAPRSGDDRPEAGSRAMPRLMRSRTLHVTSLMATAGFSLAACGQPQFAMPDPEPVLAYTSLADCKAANDIPDAECDTALVAVAKQREDAGPRYASSAECEGQWGPSQCEPLNHNGGSFFTPLLTGFVVGQMLNGGGYRGGGALYRDRDNRYSNGFGGGYLSRDYATGRTVANGRDYGDVARHAPSRVQSRTTVVSRGGFGGGGRSFGG